MKKIFRFMRASMLMLMAAVMLLGISLTANAQTIMPCCMEVAEDGRIKIDFNSERCEHGACLIGDTSGRLWSHTAQGYPFCYYEECIEVERPWGMIPTYTRYFDCYLTDYIKSHDESEWPSFIIKGSDGVPFYCSDMTDDNSNYVCSNNGTNWYYVKYCYDEKTGFWVLDKSYKGPYAAGNWGTGYVETVEMEDLIADVRKDIEEGKVVNGKAKDPVPPPCKDDLAEYDSDSGTATYPDGSVLYPDGRREYPDGHIEYSDGSTEYPDGRIEYPDGHIEYPEGHIEYSVNTLGATVTLSTDCIKVKTNKKGVVAQKPLPKSVKVGGKALKRNKTFVVSYEKYDDGGNTWNTVDAVREEGIYRLVITGQNGYEGVYTKRLYVTADKTIKAMSSVTVKVNKVDYYGIPITFGVIKSAKIGKRTLEEGTDYTVTYKNNVDSGTAQVTLKAVEGSGLLGTKTVNFTITGIKMNKVKVTGLKPLVYDPDAEMVQNMSDVQLTHSNGNHLYEGEDFTVAYANNTKAGTAKIVFTGKGLYNGTLTKTFKITKPKLTGDMLDEASQNIKMTYTGKAIKPEVSLAYGNTTLKKGTDYTLVYSNNVKVSTDLKPAWITVKGKGNYAGSFKVSFVINPKEVEDSVKNNAMSNQSVVEPEIEDTVSGNDIPETEDTVSGNDIPDAEDTVSGNDLPEADGETPAEDGTVSDNDIPAEDETPAAEEDPVADDESKNEDESKDDETKDDGSKNEDGSKDEESKSDDESKDNESKGDESTEPVVSATKPIAFVMCNCECIMPIYTYGWSEEEKTTWYEHLHEHAGSGWQAHYNSVTYEQALKNKLISEDENGHWTLLEGTLLMPPESELEESKTEEIKEPKTEESATVTTEDPDAETAEEPGIEEPKAEVDSDKRISGGTDYEEL